MAKRYKRLSGSDKYDTYIAEMKAMTIADLYIACSTVAASVATVPPVFGLFAGRAFPKGSLITEYGGEMIEADEARQLPKSKQTHIRRIPNSDFVLDGYTEAREFNKDHLPRVYEPPIELCISPWYGVTSPGKGVGFMSNTSINKSEINVVIEAVYVDSQRLTPAHLFLIAKRNIQNNEEILSPYNNNESRGFMNPNRSICDQMPMAIMNHMAQFVRYTELFRGLLRCCRYLHVNRDRICRRDLIPPEDFGC